MNSSQTANPPKDVDLLSEQRSRLDKATKIQFLTTLQPTAGTIYGHQNKPRDSEPSMKQLMSWGYEAPVKGDYIKNQTEVRYKIRKQDQEYISEVQDNYRKPEYSPEKGVHLFNYLETNAKELYKKKVYDMIVEEEAVQMKKTTYDSMFNDQEKAKENKVLQEITAAGKTQGVQQTKPLVTPQEIISKKIEEKLKQYGWNDVEYEPHLDSERQSQMETGDRNQPVTFNEMTEEQQERKKKRAAKRAQTAQQKKDQFEKRVNQIKSTSRWLPDSAITTYFGKPAFHPYGNGNTNPAVGGSVYGQYLLSHNINPQSGENKPEYKQCFGRAVIGAYNPVPKVHSKSPTKNRAVRVPHLPKKVREDIRLTPGQVEEQKARLPIMPEKHGQPEHIEIQKPDLAKEKYLQSNHSTPDLSMIQSPGPQQDQAQSQGRSNQLSKKPSERAIIKQTNNQAAPQFQTIQAQGQTQTSQTKTKPLKDIMNLIQERTKETLQKEMSKKQESPKKEEKEEPKPVEKEDIDPITQAVHQIHVTQEAPFCQEHAAQDVTEFMHLLDPKNYRFLPHSYTNMIKPAGKQSHKSDAIGSLLTWHDPTDNQ